MNFSKIFSLGLLLLTTTLGVAQMKLGHFNQQEILTKMPEYTDAYTKLESFVKTLQTEIGTYETEFQKKLEEYSKQASTLPDAVRSVKEKELRDKQALIEQLKQEAQGDLAKKEQELLKPIVEKIKENVALIAKENQYNYIFDTSMGFMVFVDSAHDITPLLKTKLGIQ